jgi:hypothetical protein
MGSRPERFNRIGKRHYSLTNNFVCVLISFAVKILATLGEGTFGKVVKAKNLRE